MKYVVIGLPQVGKTTFANYLAVELNTTATDTSEWIVETETYRQKRLKDLNVNLDGMWENERNRPDRNQLIALGDAVCKNQPDFLISRAFEKGNIIVGVRRADEFAALPNNCHVIYIDRPDRPDIKDNFNINKEKANSIVLNNGTLKDLRTRAAEIVLQETSKK